MISILIPFPLGLVGSFLTFDLGNEWDCLRVSGLSVYWIVAVTHNLIFLFVVTEPNNKRFVESVIVTVHNLTNLSSFSDKRMLGIVKSEIPINE